MIAACRDASSATSLAVAANLNTPDQTVISGDPDAVARAGERCKAAGAKRVLPLNVSGAFHSPLMAAGRGRTQGGIGGSHSRRAGVSGGRQRQRGIGTPACGCAGGFWKPSSPPRSVGWIA